MQQLTLITPDDWHCHLRDGAFLKRTVIDTASRFRRAIVMPNLAPPITTVSAALDYKQRILNELSGEHKFEPLMTLYLTEQTSIETLRNAKDAGIIACKLYPAGATTHSAAGVTEITKIYHLLEIMQAIDLPLLIHGEVVNHHIDIFDRERVFIEQELVPICEKFPKLRIVLEHISTRAAVEFVQSTADSIAATITVHHLLFNRNALLVGGLHPHYYCLPILKTADDQQALIAAAISGKPKFFLGTDSAPHARQYKEAACGCAGIYSAHAAIELYAQVFAKHQALDRLEAFASIFGAEFYGLPRNSSSITLIEKPWQIPLELSFGEHQLTPLCSGETIDWQLL